MKYLIATIAALALLFIGASIGTQDPPSPHSQLVTYSTVLKTGGQKYSSMLITNTPRFDMNVLNAVMFHATRDTNCHPSAVIINVLPIH